MPTEGSDTARAKLSSLGWTGMRQVTAGLNLNPRPAEAHLRPNAATAPATSTSSTTSAAVEDLVLPLGVPERVERHKLLEVSQRPERLCGAGPVRAPRFREAIVRT